MKTLKIVRPKTLSMCIALAACIFFAAAEPLQAQRAIGRGATRGRGKRDKTRKPNNRDNRKAGDMPGSRYSRILKFTPETSDEDENLIGTLRVKPVEKGTKTLKLRVRDSESLTISVGGHPFSIEEFPDILWKGLYCTTGWDYEATEGKKKPVHKELTVITFDTLDVEGTIQEIEGDLVVIKARPLTDRAWPHLPTKQPSHTRRSNNDKPKPIRQLKLKLRIMDDLATFTDAKKHELTLGDFEVDQSVQATVVLGSSVGMLVNLRTLTAESDEDELDEQPRRGRGRIGPRGGRGRGRIRPGGGGRS